MEYPGTKFTHPIRFSMLILFIALFFLITPIIILYSAGYRLDLRNGLLRETGSLSIDILPKNASVYLDGLNLDQTMPVRLNNITPHKYTLKITAAGYYDWEKQIEINKNQTTYIKEFVLLKKAKPSLITKDNAGQLALSNSGRYLAYTISRTNETDVIVADEQKQAQNLTLKMTGALTLTWAPLSDNLAVKSAGSGRLVVLSAKTGNTAEIHNADPIIKYVWSNNSDPNLYYSTRNGIYSFLPDIKESSLITASKFLDWYMNDDTLWTMNINTSTSELNIIKDSLGFKNLFASFSAIGTESTSTLATSQFETIEHGTVILRNQTGDRLYIIRPDTKFTINADYYFFSKFNNWWLFWNQYELWTYSEGDEPVLLNRSGAKFENILPLDQFNTLALQRNGEISALFPYFYLDRSLIDDNVKTMTIDPTNRILYFNNDKGIWKLNY